MIVTRFGKLLAVAALALPLLTPPARPAEAAPLVAVLEAEVATLDPHYSTAYITRAFGYTVFDTLFGLTANGEIRPQMVQDTVISDDRLTYTVTGESGPAHDKRFQVTVALNGKALAVGEGRSKKAAEQQAAKAALTKLEQQA